MHAAPASTRRGFFRVDWREIGLWSAAGLVVIGVHAGAAWSLKNIQPVEPAGEVAAAVMIDMEPLPEPVVAEPAKVEAPVEPEPVRPEPVQQEAAAPEPQVQPEPEQQVQPPEEVKPDKPQSDVAEKAISEPEEALRLDEQTEDLVELPKVEVPLPVMRPEARKFDAPKKQIVEKAARKPAKKLETAVVNDAMPREAKAQSTATSAAPAKQTERWGAKLEAYLRRRTQRMRSKEGGTVSIAITVTRGGDILSARVAGSSGSPQLDQSVLETVRRASPVPSAPDEVAVSTQSFTVPFRVE
jgi:protein TonB